MTLPPFFALCLPSKCKLALWISQENKLIKASETELIHGGTKPLDWPLGPAHPTLHCFLQQDRSNLQGDCSLPCSDATDLPALLILTVPHLTVT